MSTTSNPTILSPKAQTLGLINRLQRDLDELTRVAKGADLLPIGDTLAFDVGCHLAGSRQSLQNAIDALQGFVDRQARFETALAAVNELFPA
jgi:hypothetical protein